MEDDPWGVAWRQRFVFMGVVGYLVLFPILFLQPNRWAHLATLFGLMFSGWEGGVPTGYSVGLLPLEIALLAWLQDLFGVLIVLPFMAKAGGWLDERWGYVHYVRERIHDSASIHAPRLRRYGYVGVSVFMMIPFLVNGAMVAMLAARVLRLRRAPTILTVFGTNLLLAVGWSLMYRSILRGLDQLSRWGVEQFALVFMGAVLLFGLLGFLVSYRNYRRLSTP